MGWDAELNNYSVCLCPLRQFSDFQVFGFSGFQVLGFSVYVGWDSCYELRKNLLFYEFHDNVPLVPALNFGTPR